MNDDARQRYERRVKALEAFGHRGSTSENEAKAAAYLSDEMQAMGLQPGRERFFGASSLGLVLLIHVLTAATGACLLWHLPVMTVLLGALALSSFLVESTSRGYSLGWFARLGSSQNISAAIPASQGDPRLRIVVLGHYDTQRTGIMWNEGLLNMVIPLLYRSPGIVKSPNFPIVLAMLLQILAGILALIWGNSFLIRLLGSVSLLVYAVSGILLGQWAFGAFVPGANDNATGAAAVLTLAEFWMDQPAADVEAVFLLPGCEETGLTGAAVWAKSHRAECRKTPTLFLNVDSLGYGTPRFVSRELTNSAIPVSYPQEMINLAKEVAIEHGLEFTEPLEVPVPSDGLALLVRGIRGMTIHSFEKDHSPNYHQMTDTSDRMNFDAAWRAVRFAWDVLQRMSKT